MKAREVAGGGRAVEVTPERLGRWFENFGIRNGGISATTLSQEEIIVYGGNGTTARVAVPFPPLPGVPATPVEYPDLAVDALIEHATRQRRIGLVLVRKGAHSVGVAHGETVVVSRTDTHYVQGRTAAGGTSQQRFARRRQEQSTQALRKAAEDVFEVVGRRLSSLDAVVLGGDHAALDQVRSDPRLQSVFEHASARVLDVAEPRRRVLDDAARRARSLEIVIQDAPR